MFHYKYFRYYTLTNSVTLPLMYFRFNYVTVFACIFVTIIVSVNEMDVFPLTDISVIVNGKNTAFYEVAEAGRNYISGMMHVPSSRLRLYASYHDCFQVKSGQERPLRGQPAVRRRRIYRIRMCVV
jgi:hypothetical protein